MLMAADIRLGLDSALIGERAGLKLDAWQASLLTERPKRALLCCSRQSGKSTVTALLALWTAIYQAPALILIVSPSLRQSGEMFRTLMSFYSKLDCAPPLVAESVLRAEFGNGSRIISLPGSEKTTRGYSGAHLVICDEAARCDDALMAAVRPAMATVDGSLIALSTPAGRRGWFFESFIGIDPQWTRVQVPASECPRLSKEFLDGEKRALGALRYAEEYELQFLDDELAVFPMELIDRAFDPELRPLWQ